MKKENTTATATTTDEFEKVDVQIVKLKAGESFVGILTDVSQRPWFDKEQQKEVMIDQYSFTDANGKMPFAYFGDGGFKNVILTANIKVGDKIKVVKGEKTAMSGGRTVNTYELYKAKASVSSHQ